MPGDPFRAVRSMRPADMDAVAALCRSRSYPSYAVRGVAPAVRLESRLQHYRNDDVLAEPAMQGVVVESSGGEMAAFALLLSGLMETITAETQMLVYDWGVAAGADAMPVLMAECFDRARAGGARHLVVEIAPGVLEDEARFRSCGFFVDMNRIAKRVRPSESGPAEGYRIRPAVAGDHMFILWLNSLCAPYTIPPGREVDPVEVGRRYFDHYLSLPVEGDEQTRVLIAEETARREAVGYIIVKFGFHDDVSHEPAAYVHDIALHPDHWGKGVSEALTNAAEAMLQERAIGLLLGDISEANPRALQRALTTTGFALEWRRWTRPIDPA